MEEGEIVGQGTHEELLKNCEEYQEIYYSQKGKDEEVSA
jgi:ATP-binding cassette subfamily B protein